MCRTPADEAVQQVEEGDRVLDARGGRSGWARRAVDESLEEVGSLVRRWVGSSGRMAAGRSLAVGRLERREGSRVVDRLGPVAWWVRRAGGMGLRVSF